jgi:hypothetical protein
VRPTDRALAALLALYPAPFRDAYGEEMARLVRDQRRTLGTAGPATVARFWLATALDVLRTAPREHLDARRAGRTPALAAPPEGSMLVPVLNVLVALLLGFGAVQEIVVRRAELQPVVIGSLGVVACALLLASAVALARRTAGARTLTLVAGAASVAFHAYAALPPHRNVGPPALLLGVGYGLFLLLYARRNGPSPALAPR